MSRAPGLCISARSAAPIAQCESCHGDICAKHARWQGDYYLCYKCERQGKTSDIRIELPKEYDGADSGFGDGETGHGEATGETNRKVA